MKSSTNSTQFQPSEAELVQLQTSAHTARPLRRGCVISILVIAAIIGAPAYWWMSSYAPVTLFPAHGTLNVTSDEGECGRWDTTVWPQFNSLLSEVVAVDATSEKDLWVATRKGDILRGDGNNWQHIQTLKTIDGKAVYVRELDAQNENDVWVLGDSEGLHWDGKSFQQVEMPHQLTWNVSSMAVVTEGNAWFVGSYGHIWHWDGEESTAIEPVDRDLKRFHFTGVSAVSADDIWAVGIESGQSYGDTVAAHWDGKEWTIAKRWGQVESIVFLYDVLAIAKDDVWAMGGDKVVHWNGHEWTISETPSFEDYSSVNFRSITASASDDVWALGYRWYDGPHPLTVHWDGSKWSVISAPRPLNLGGFDGAKAFPGKLWAAGNAYQDEDFGPVYTMSAEFKPMPCR